MAVETSEYLAMLRRMIRAAGRRVAEADEPEMAELQALRAEIDKALEVAALGQHEALDRSWAWVGESLGMSKQAAHKKYAKR